MSLGPIDYRTPTTSPRALPVIHERLLMREHMMLGKIALLLLLGLAASLLLPGIICIIGWTATSRFGGRVMWGVIFWICAIVMVSVLLCIEYWTRGRYFAQRPIASDDDWANARGSGLRWNSLAWSYGDSEAASWVSVVIALWGARQILDAIGKIRMVRQTEFVNRNRAEAILARLLSSEYGLEVETLTDGSAADTEELLRALAYLLVYDWIGASKDGKRVWLPSDTRATLKA